MKIKSQIKVTIKNLNHNGQGVGVVNGFTVIVDGSAPGDTLLCEITNANPKKRVAYGKIIKIFELSADRIKTFCKSSFQEIGSCGGCLLGHLNKNVQSTFKTALVKEIISHKKIEVAFSFTPPVKTSQYRNRSNFIPFKNKNGEVLTGSYKRGTSIPVSMRGCEIVEPAINTTIKQIEIHLNSLNPEEYDRLAIRYITVRTNGQNETLTDLTLNIEADKIKSALTKHIANQLLIKKITDGVSFSSNTSTGNAIRTSDPVLYFGKKSIIQKMDNINLQLFSSTFFQLNTSVANQMYSDAAFESKNDDTIWDLYCGIGGLGLFCAGTHENQKIFGADNVESSIVSAKENAKINNVENAKFETVNLAEETPDNWPSPDIIYVNPPRRGIDKNVINLLKTVTPDKIVYMSCNPKSFAEDAVELLEAGYRLDRLQGYDMLPKTPHVELLGFFYKV